MFEGIRAYLEKRIFEKGIFKMLVGLGIFLALVVGVFCSVVYSDKGNLIINVDNLFVLLITGIDIVSFGYCFGVGIVGVLSFLGGAWLLERWEEKIRFRFQELGKIIFYPTNWLSGVASNAIPLAPHGWMPDQNKERSEIDDGSGSFPPVKVSTLD